MSDVTGLELVRGLYDYHWWANRRLFDVAARLDNEAVGRAVGTQFSVPSVKGMFVHIYGADWVWFERWQGRTPAALPADAEFPTLATLRERWDPFEAKQRAFIAALTPADLGRVMEFTSRAYPSRDGRPYRVPLWPLLQHVANHATHHRSEIATMLTMLSGSPPGTDLALYYFIQSGHRDDA